MKEVNTPRADTNNEAGAHLAEHFLKYLPACNPGLVCVVRHSDMSVLYSNEQFAYHLGYTTDDLIDNGIVFTDLLEDYHYDHLQYQLSNVDESIPARSAYVIYSLKTKKGVSQPFYLFASPFMPGENPYGRLYFILMMPDMSKWGMPFTSFDTKELFLEQFDSLEFGTFEWVTEVDKVYFSAGLQRILEVERGVEINAATARSFINPNDLETVNAAVMNAFETGDDLNIEFRILTAKNAVKTIHCLGRLIKNDSGKLSKFAGSLRDVTQQRAIENDLKNKVDELYHSNKELEEFAYVASHDLQEPLRKITTFSDRLSEKYKSVLTGDGELYLTRMNVSAENMRRLINDLLEFSRVAKTSQPFEPVNLNLIIRQVKQELELVIEETNTVIHAEGLPTIDAINTQMKQLFTNILNNAIKFRKADTAPDITIETIVASEKEKLKHDLSPSKNYYKIQITDNGIGFEDEYALRIFQVFQRLHGKAEYPGSGIGLAICKKIVEYHHGVIYAENIPGTGARFTFIVPEQQ
ncbi:MAG: ATP-binding protein [Bacteroidota bacterium]